MRNAFDHLDLQGVIPGNAQGRLELTDAAVLRKGLQGLEYRARIGEIGVGFLEARGHGGGAGDGGTQQRTHVRVGEVAESVRGEGRRTDHIVVDQVADVRIVEALGTAVEFPNALVADESRFHKEVADDFALQRDVPLKNAGRPSHVRVHDSRSALDAAAGHHIEAGIVGRAPKSVLVENQRLGHLAGRDAVSGRRNGDRVKAHAGSGRIGEQRNQGTIADTGPAAQYRYGIDLVGQAEARSDGERVIRGEQAITAPWTIAFVNYRAEESVGDRKSTRLNSSH